jgi:tRNA-modifying protein YgfZ
MNPLDSLLSQHAALTSGVGIADLSNRTRLEIRGSDRVSFLHAFCTNDIKRLAVGQGCEAFITSPQGKTLGHVFAFRETDRLLLETSPGQADALIAHFNKYVISEDVEFIDRTAQTGEWLVAGSLASALLSRLCGVEPLADILSTTACHIADGDEILRKTEIVGSLSYLIESALVDALQVKHALLAAGAVLCDPDAVESARLEAGFPLYGQDITDDNLPQEVGRDPKAISFTKGCYLGQETVARIDALGHVNRLLVAVKWSGAEIPSAGTPLLASGKEVGRVTSAAWSPALNAPLALAYVRRAHSANGALLESQFGPAEVFKRPAS